MSVSATGEAFSKGAVVVGSSVSGAPVSGTVKSGTDVGMPAMHKLANTPSLPLWHPSCAVAAGSAWRSQGAAGKPLVASPSPPPPCATQVRPRSR